MVHEKYIKKDGKVYGPYLYKNYRVNGVTKTKYLGAGKLPKKNYSNYFIFGGLFFLLMVLIFSFSFFYSGLVEFSVLTEFNEVFGIRDLGFVGSGDGEDRLPTTDYRLGTGSGGAGISGAVVLSSESNIGDGGNIGDVAVGSSESGVGGGNGSGELPTPNSQLQTESEEGFSELEQLESELVSEGYEWLINYTGDVSNIFLENYSCNSTGYETSKVLTEGVHNLLFEFGGANATAHNFAVNDTPTAFTLQDALAEGKWTWWMNCTSGDASNVSEVRTLYIDSTPLDIVANGTPTVITIESALAAGTYSWWVDCTTDVYWINHTADSVVNSSEVRNLGIEPLTSHLKIWDDSDSGTTYSNYTKFYANWTAYISRETVNGSDKWCEFSHNKTGSWSSAVNMSFNATSLLYEFTGDCGYLNGHGCVPVGSYGFNVSCFDGSLGFTNLSVADGVLISEYNTSLAIENDTAKSIGEMVNFYANFSSFAMGNVEGIGDEISPRIWNTGDTNGRVSYSLRFFDQDKDGKKDEIVLGTDYDVYIYYENGTLNIDSPNLAPGNFHDMYDMEVGDINGDGFEDDFVVSSGYSGQSYKIAVLNRIGDVINGTMASPLGLGDVHWISLGDVDGDGVVDSIFSSAGCALLNSTDGINWDIAWNKSSNCGDSRFGDFDDDGVLEIVTPRASASGINFTMYELNGTEAWFVELSASSGISLASRIDVGDMDGDGKDNDFAIATYGYGVYLVNQFGQSINVAGSYVNSWPNFIDIDGDGIDEIVFDSSGDDVVSAKYKNGTEIWSYGLSSTGVIRVYDVNGDGEEEIIIAEALGNYLIILNKTGSLLSKTKRSSVTGGMGPCSGSSYCPLNGWPIDFGDVNNDGLTDIAVISGDGYLDVFQDVSCTANFNDSNSYNMTWDVGLSKWKVNRTFDSAGDYDWNVTCEKGGYVTAVSSEVLGVYSLEIEVVSPDNSSSHYSSVIDFNVSVSAENSDVDVCWFELDDSGSNVTMSEFNSSYFNYSYSGIGHGLHNISFWCNNSVGREATATELNFDVVLADVTVSDVTVPSVVYSNSTFIEINISNIGVPAVSDVNVSCYFDGEMFDSKLISSIGGGSYYMTNCTLDETSQMNKLLNVSVDVDNLIPESDETNNEWTSYIDVLQLTGLGVWDLEEDEEEGVGRWGLGVGSETLPDDMEYFFANWTMDNSSASVEGASCSIAFGGGGEGGTTSGSFWDSSQEDFDLGSYVQTLFNSSGYVQLDLTYDSGNLTSRVFDMGTSVSYQNLSWSEERISCPEGMAYINKLNGFCIDKYEASTPGCEVVGDNCGSYQSASYCPAYCIPDEGVFGTTSGVGTTAVAYSKVNVAPLVGVSQYQARQLCANAGKHLCTDEEWLAAANLQGQVYDLPVSLSASPYDCVVDSSEYCSHFILNYACNTSYNKNGVSGCYSSEGVYDMVGNVWEWTNETVDVTNPDGVAGWKYPNSTQGWQTTTGAETAIYGNDGTYFPLTTTGRAVLRGGYWYYGAYAGPFCAFLSLAPTYTYYYIGFRCCSS